jgi:formate-dependent nitrite reductase membrane component NrfD
VKEVKPQEEDGNVKFIIMEIFKNDNNWNEKAIVGFIAFAIMCLIMIADLVTGWVGSDLIINEYVYNSFVWVVLGSFGISGVEKFAKK